MLIEEGNKDFVQGFMHGYWGEPFNDSNKTPEYKEGYGRGYETSERESALSTYKWEKKQ